jgi:hydrophobe/amphiphile efflux-3 (HAE3) family protein
MRRFWSLLAVHLGKRAGVVSLVGLVVTVGLGFGATRLEFATGLDSYLNKDEQTYKDNAAYQQEFGGQAMLTAITLAPGHRVDELLDLKGQVEFRRFYDELTATGRYQAVVTPVMALEFIAKLAAPGADGTTGSSIYAQALLEAIGSETQGTPEYAARLKHAQDTAASSASVTGQHSLTNPEFVRSLLYDGNGKVRSAASTFFPDERHAVILVRLKGGQPLAEEGLAAVAVQEKAKSLKFENATVVSTGSSILLKDINDYLEGGMLSLSAIALGIMVVILLTLFKVRWRLLPLGVIVVGVIWAFGLAGYLGIPLTVVTIAGLPVMLGVGIDYAIQMQARVEEEARTARTGHPIQATARGLCPALLVVTFDAVFAFAALRFAKVPMIRQFGLLLAVGIAVICIASIVLPLASLGIREYRSPTPPREFNEGALGRFVVKLGRLPANIAVPLAVASIVIFLGGLAVEGKLTLQTDPIQWVNQDSQTVKDINTLRTEVGSSSELGMFVQSKDVFSAESIDYMHQLGKQQVATHKGELLSASSVESLAGGLVEVPGASEVVPTGAQAKTIFDAAPKDIQALLVNPDHTGANVLFRIGGGVTLDRQAEIVKDLRTTASPPPGVRVAPAGLAVIGVGLLQNLESNRIILTYLSMLFVFLFLAVRLRSVLRSLLSLVPVTIAVGAASLFAWAFDLKLSPMTSVGGPIVVATCTEFTSLILLRFLEERNRGLEPREAMDVAASRTGRAFIVSGLTATAGVAVLSFSSLPLLRDFGRIVAMNVFVALASALIVLPPLLVYGDRFGWVTHGMLRPDDEDEWIPTDHDGGGRIIDLDAPAPEPAHRPLPV